MDDWVLGSVICFIAVVNYAILRWMLTEEEREYEEAEAEFKRELESHWHNKER